MEQREVGVTVAEAQARDAFAGAEAGDPGADGHHRTGELAPERHRLRGLGDLADDREGDAHRLAAHEELAGARLGDGCLLQGQRATHGLVTDTTHRPDLPLIHW